LLKLPHLGHLGLFIIARRDACRLPSMQAALGLLRFWLYAVKNLRAQSPLQVYCCLP
jgi:hypothetical protein